MHNSLDCEDSCYPTMKKKVGRIWPIRYPQKEVITSRKEYKQWKKRVANMTCSVANVR